MTAMIEGDRVQYLDLVHIVTHTPYAKTSGAKFESPCTLETRDWPKGCQVPANTVVTCMRCIAEGPP